jgi:hypothetical protein
MDALDKPLTLEVSVPRPYVHLDNRALVLHDGRATVVYGNAAFAWISETLRLVIDEGRATRQQSQQTFGGFVHDDGAGTATLIAGTASGFVTCDISLDGLRELHARLGRR